MWNNYRCHLTIEVRSALKQMRTVMACVPSGCTKLVQPADVSWDAPFKAAYRELYETWLNSGEHGVTVHGNPRAPNKRDIVFWIKHACDPITLEVIIRSFEA